MNSSMKLLLAVIGYRRLSRRVRALWVGSQRMFPMGKRSLRFVKGDGFRIGNRVTASAALRRELSHRAEWRREEYRIRRRPFADWAV